MAKDDNAEKKFEALRKSGFKGPVDHKGNAVMSRTDGKGNPLGLFHKGSSNTGK
jgi:hypothetical protein